MFKVQQALNLNDSIDVGCSVVKIDSKKLAVKLISIGGGRVKYFALIPTTKRMPFDDAVELADLDGGGEVYLSSMDDIGVKKVSEVLANLEHLLRENKSAQNMFDRADLGGYEALRSTRGSSFDRDYSVPELKLTASFRGIQYEEGMLIFAKRESCRGSDRTVGR